MQYLHNLLVSNQIIALFLSIVSLILTYAFGRYILKYNNITVLDGVLMGGRSSNPALGLLLERAGNSILIAFFIITYTVANIAFTLFGPIIIY